MPLDDNPTDPSHEYDLIRSETPITEDGYRVGEPKKLACHFCDAEMILTEDKTPGVWELNHEPWCPDVSD